jgi:predicted N-formylglutamate amidohydrolase
MNWNPYKRIAELEAMHTKNIAVLDTLADKLDDLDFKHNVLSELVIAIDRQINPRAAAPMRSEGKLVSATAKVADAAEQKRIKQREYSKAHYAKKKARAKQNEYQRAYRARKKAAAQALGGTA